MPRQKAHSAYLSFEKLLSALIAARVEFVQVGKRIREIREKELGLGQKEFAHRIGKTQTDISHYERGERIKDRAEALLRIAELDPKKRGIRWLLGGWAGVSSFILCRKRCYAARESEARNHGGLICSSGTPITAAMRWSGLLTKSVHGLIASLK